MSIGQRIANARTALGMSQESLAKKLGVSRVAVTNWERDTNLPRHDKLEAIGAVLRVAPAWLLTGHTETPEPTSESSDRGAVLELDVTASAGSGAVVDYEGPNHLWHFPDYFVRSEMHATANNLRIVAIRGDSMQSDPPKPTDIGPGDRVIVNISDRSPTPPGLFLVHDGLGLVAKRVTYVPHSDPPRIRILSNNPNYEPYERTLEEAVILGRIVGRWQRL